MILDSTALDALYADACEAQREASVGACSQDDADRALARYNDAAARWNAAHATDDRDGECDTCECTGRVTVTVDDGEGGYDGSAPCPVCR